MHKIPPILVYFSLKFEKWVTYVGTKISHYYKMHHFVKVFAVGTRAFQWNNKIENIAVLWKYNLIMLPVLENFINTFALCVKYTLELFRLLL